MAPGGISPNNILGVACLYPNLCRPGACVEKSPRSAPPVPDDGSCSLLNRKGLSSPGSFSVGGPMGPGRSEAEQFEGPATPVVSPTGAVAGPELPGRAAAVRHPPPDRLVWGTSPPFPPRGAGGRWPGLSRRPHTSPECKP